MPATRTAVARLPPLVTDIPGTPRSPQSAAKEAEASLAVKLSSPGSQTPQTPAAQRPFHAARSPKHSQFSPLSPAGAESASVIAAEPGPEPQPEPPAPRPTLPLAETNATDFEGLGNRTMKSRQNMFKNTGRLLIDAVLKPYAHTIGEIMCASGRERSRVQGGHSNPLGIFLRTYIHESAWIILSAFSPS